VQAVAVRHGQVDVQDGRGLAVECGRVEHVQLARVRLDLQVVAFAFRI
jgi:hypothetical protein